MKKEVKLKDLTVGTIFTISETPSYPKLRTEYGYLDMRDKIKIECEDLKWDIREMTKAEVAKQFDGTVQEIEDWIDSLTSN